MCMMVVDKTDSAVSRMKSDSFLWVMAVGVEGLSTSRMGVQHSMGCAVPTAHMGALTLFMLINQLFSMHGCFPL